MSISNLSFKGPYYNYSRYNKSNAQSIGSDQEMLFLFARCVLFDLPTNEKIDINFNYGNLFRFSSYLTMTPSKGSQISPDTVSLLEAITFITPEDVPSALIEFKLMTGLQKPTNESQKEFSEKAILARSKGATHVQGQNNRLWPLNDRTGHKDSNPFSCMEFS